MSGFLSRVAIGLACFACSALATHAADRPNFLFIFADDQRHDAMSCVQSEQGEKGRFPWFRTPNMDRLAREGIRFRNAFVVNSLCSPSRACFLTGRYNHHNGIVNNRTEFSAANPTHASILRGTGYCTGYVGKWHMSNQTARPGFDWYASFTGHARYVDPVYLVNGKRTPTTGWIDDLSADFAIQFLEKDRAKEKPFSLVVGFKSPHGPFDPPARLKSAFTGELARRVPNLGLAPGFNPSEKPVVAKTDAARVPVNLNYFRCISALDENLGRILDALERLHLAENTVVVYASDNGFYLGEHTLADKRSAYDESLRIPMIVRYPKAQIKGQVRDELVLNLDLAPTFLDLAGTVVPAEMQGKSWKPLLTSIKQDPTAFRTAFFYEYFRENGGKGAPGGPGGYNTPTMTGVRTTTAKILKYEKQEEWTEVFDLVNDPYETKNLASDPAHAALRMHLEAEHARRAKEVGYFIPANVDKPTPRTP